ncbi:MAG: DUF2860 domain-containing protein [Desulfobacula sp.]|nr:DUF2860 domain-containing protein [Desulfobacula sp.]
MKILNTLLPVLLFSAAATAPGQEIIYPQPTVETHCNGSQTHRGPESDDPLQIGTTQHPVLTIQQIIYCDYYKKTVILSRNNSRFIQAGDMNMNDLKPAYRFACFLVILFLVSPVYADAQEKDSRPELNRFFGRIEFGAAGVSSDSNFLAFDKKESILFYHENNLETISDLNDSASRSSFLPFLVLFEVNYLIKDDMLFYFGTPFFDDDREGLTAGIEKLFENNSVLDLSIFVESFSTWEDPYIINVEREMTLNEASGISISYQEIFGTDLGINYTIKGMAVEDDISGKNNPALAREGSMQSIRAGYDFFLSEKEDTVLTPAIIASRERMDGDALANKTYGLELAYGRNKPNYAVFVSGTMQKIKYDNIHPVFNKKISGDQYTAKFVYTKNNIWKDRWYLKIGFGGSYMDSNTDFFDHKIYLGGVSIGFLFE